MSYKDEIATKLIEALLLWKEQGGPDGISISEATSIAAIRNPGITESEMRSIVNSTSALDLNEDTIILNWKIDRSHVMTSYSSHSRGKKKMHHKSHATCPHCGKDTKWGTCPAIKSNGEVCGSKEFSCEDDDVYNCVACKALYNSKECDHCGQQVPAELYKASSLLASLFAV